jgi:hypothetical protein
MNAISDSVNLSGKLPRNMQYSDYYGNPNGLRR